MPLARTTLLLSITDRTTLREWKKKDNTCPSTSSPNIYRFLKFFHCFTLQGLFPKKIVSRRSHHTANALLHYAVQY